MEKVTREPAITLEPKSVSTQPIRLSLFLTILFSVLYRNERAISPSESIVSVTSHLPPQIGHSTSARGATNSSNARSGNPSASGTNKRARASANNNSNRNPTPLADEPYPAAPDSHTNGHVNGSRRAVADVYNVPPSASHPSLPQPYQNGNGHLTNGYDANGISHPVAQEWNIPHPQQLEGPGMPVARSASIHSTATSMPIIASAVVESTDAGDGDADGDDGRTYCFCEGVSYGEMIACDDSHCEREWVRFFVIVYLSDCLSFFSLLIVPPPVYWPGSGT